MANYFQSNSLSVNTATRFHPVFLAEQNLKDIEHNEDNFKKYDFLLKLFDKVDIINQINLEKS